MGVLLTPPWLFPNSRLLFFIEQKSGDDRASSWIRYEGCLLLRLHQLIRRRIRVSIRIATMTEYWVSQGNKWCDICKTFISNNEVGIRNHEMGQRHKDSVTKRLAAVRKDNAAKEKAQKEAARALEQIEAKAQRSYQKDLAALREGARNAQAFSASKDGWEHDSTSGYYFNRANTFCYDPKSGLYYSESLGKWVAEEEAFPPSQNASASESKTVEKGTGDNKYKKGTAPGLVVPGSVNSMRSVKGAPSSIAVNKRKRQDGKPKVVSKEEAEALKAREAAKKRVEEREKPMLGLYKSYGL